MESNVSLAQASSEEVVLPARVQEALGQLVGSAKEGLLALSVGVGLGVLAELLEEEVVEVVGAKGKHNPERVAVRHGHESGEVTLGGRRVQVERPRVRSAKGRAEVRLATYEHFADRDLLSRVVLERMLAGVSTRRYQRTQEPVGGEVEQEARSTSRSAVSRTFVERTRRSLGELMSRRLEDVRLAVMMLDGLEPDRARPRASSAGGRCNAPASSRQSRSRRRAKACTGRSVPARLRMKRRRRRAASRLLSDSRARWARSRRTRPSGSPRAERRRASRSPPRAPSACRRSRGRRGRPPGPRARPRSVRRHHAARCS